jgi:hypothetical protein
MKHTPLFLVTALLLAGCSTQQLSDALKQNLENPLYAERYYEDLVDQMVDLEIAEPDMREKDADKASLVERTKNDALAKAKEQARKRLEGKSGRFIEVNEIVEGVALLLNNTLYISSDFLAFPGPSVHVYLTTAVDPRDASFPDSTAVDLGLIQSPYGAQTYALPSNLPQDAMQYRTVVIYDDQLKRIYSFAQLAR